MTRFQSNLSCLKDDLTFDSRKRSYIIDSVAVRCPSDVAVKQAQVITPSPSCLIFLGEFQYPRGSARYNFSHSSHAIKIILERCCFLLASLPKKLHMRSIFLIAICFTICHAN
ncbi:hypothetical protein ILYODFUR_030024 [Ilyodon furcidens]|uniref:Uncharacterized protein n=1 Tax=Ilyodon furcidens TaxID=33524 RepID=A0ABV0UWF3_9TELE